MYSVVCITVNMAERLTNPKNLKIDLLALPIVELEGSKYRLYERIGTRVEKYTGCQCYKDCNCSGLYPRIINYHHKWYRHISHDGTDRAFHSVPKL